MSIGTLPLSRFTVLDLTHARAGPTAVRQLADWGANVIKIEPRGDSRDVTGSDHREEASDGEHEQDCFSRRTGHYARGVVAVCVVAAECLLASASIDGTKPRNVSP